MNSFTPFVTDNNQNFRSERKTNNKYNLTNE